MEVGGQDWLSMGERSDRLAVSEASLADEIAERSEASSSSFKNIHQTSSAPERERKGERENSSTQLMSFR